MGALIGAMVVALAAAPAAHAQLGPPLNDAFAAALPLVGPAAVGAGTNSGATAEASEPYHHGSRARSVWWRWVAPADGEVAVSTEGSSFATVVAVYTGTSVDRLSLVASHSGYSKARPSRAIARVSAGTTYMIAVDGYSGASGTIALTLTHAPPPVNDRFADALPLVGPVAATTGTTIGASRETYEPQHGSAGTRSVWWTWTAPSS